jgi:hypothetical protein
VKHAEATRKTFDRRRFACGFRSQRVVDRYGE